MAKKVPLINSDKMATVDDEDFAFVMQYKWRLEKVNDMEYAATGYPPIFMHNLIMQRSLASQN